jgi:ketosteroid isomerase-like protein
MSQENIDRLRAGYEAFGGAGEYDIDFLLPDFELHQASSIIDTAGVFRGREALRDVMRELEESFEQLSFEAEKFIEAPGGEVVVFIYARGRGRGSRLEIDNHIAHVWTFRDHKAALMVVYEDPAEALEAIGLTGPLD